MFPQENIRTLLHKNPNIKFPIIKNSQILFKKKKFTKYKKLKKINK